MFSDRFHQAEGTTLPGTSSLLWQKRATKVYGLAFFLCTSTLTHNPTGVFELQVARLSLAVLGTNLRIFFRHNKIRCDDGRCYLSCPGKLMVTLTCGDRPCGGCRKRGLTAAQCIDGCDACRRTRLRCDGGIPCDRCRLLGIRCIEEPGLHAVKPHDVYSPSPERVKLACKSCRRDNKKVLCPVTIS